MSQGHFIIGARWRGRHRSTLGSSIICNHFLARSVSSSWNPITSFRLMHILLSGKPIVRPFSFHIHNLRGIFDDIASSFYETQRHVRDSVHNIRQSPPDIFFFSITVMFLHRFYPFLLIEKRWKFCFWITRVVKGTTSLLIAFSSRVYLCWSMDTSHAKRESLRDVREWFLGWVTGWR